MTTIDIEHAGSTHSVQRISFPWETGPEQPDWRLSGACIGKDAELFFVPRSGNTLPAKQICAACPVRRACLEWAIDVNERCGVWGGMSERERAALVRAGWRAGDPLPPVRRREWVAA